MKKFLKFTLLALLFSILFTVVFLPSLYIWRPAVDFSVPQVIRDGDAVPAPGLPIANSGCAPSENSHQPPCNRSLAGSVWSITHAGSYAQGSSPLPGPTGERQFLAQHIDLANAAITYNFTTPYADGGVAVWGALLSLDGVVVKLDHAAFAVIDAYNPQHEESDPPALPLSISGAYSLIDRDNRFIVVRQRSIEVYADSIPGDRFSPIALVQRLELPDDFFCGDEDLLVGLNMTYDDHLVLATERGQIGVLPRDLSVERLQRFGINGENCTGRDVPLISNSIAVDETGGIFVVTSREALRVQWDGAQLSLAWRVPYASGEGTLSALRLGPGSGSTPSLMGTGAQDDRFVVFTDGQDLMHLVLLWRDEIPDDWEPIAADKDPRIACEVPIRFGDPEAGQSLSEQSVLVRGYGMVLVNNLLQDEPGLLKRLPNAAGVTLAALAGNDPDQAPYGLERLDWDPVTRTCQPVWVNTTVSIPNGVPTMSEATGLIYAIGQREGVWGLEAVDFSTGLAQFFVPSRQKRCSMSLFEQINRVGMRFVVFPIMATYPAACENTLFAATEIGPDQTIYTGTLLGVTKFSTTRLGEP